MSLVSYMPSYSTDTQWYRFDDEKSACYIMYSFLELISCRVTHSNLEACLNSSAYMCFYVKRHLDYKPDITPTYRLTRETEAIREKEMEKEKAAAREKELEDALLATV